MINKAFLKDCAEKFGVFLDDTALERFDIYARRLIEKNLVMNLTAITEPDEIVIKHFTDSLSVLSCVDIPAGAKIIDVGTGAGFPGVPLLFVRPDLNVTLLDGTGKKLAFIGEALDETGLRAETVHLRAEEAGRKPEYRERFDFAAARAVAGLSELAEYCLPLVKVGGTFVAMKSARADSETGEAKNAVLTLGGGKTEIKRFFLPDNSERSLVIIKKVSQTPTKYPRSSANIAKRPLR
jgi:16S rRNA (guanine527-N7)-methyltransferase